MARLTLAAIERVFRRRGWRYELTDHGRILTSFDDVTIIIGVEHVCQGALVLAGIYIPEEANHQATLARGRDVDVFVAALNFAVGSPNFHRDRQDGAVTFIMSVPAPGGLLDPAQLVEALRAAVRAALSFGPTVEDIVRGRLSLDAALDILDRVVAQIERERRGRTA